MVEGSLRQEKTHPPPQSFPQAQWQWLMCPDVRNASESYLKMAFWLRSAQNSFWAAMSASRATVFLNCSTSWMYSFLSRPIFLMSLRLVKIRLGSLPIRHKPGWFSFALKQDLLSHLLSTEDHASKILLSTSVVLSLEFKPPGAVSTSALFRKAVLGLQHPAVGWLISKSFAYNVQFQKRKEANMATSPRILCKRKDQGTGTGRWAYCTRSLVALIWGMTLGVGRLSQSPDIPRGITNS